MDSTMQAVLQFVEENDVKFIRLAFCDVMGTLKNIAIMGGMLFVVVYGSGRCSLDRLRKK